MRNVFMAWVLALFCAIGAHAINYTPQNLPKVHVEDRNRYVTNPDGLLTAPVVAQMDSMLRALEDSTGIQTVVVAVKSIGEATPFDFCHELLNQWGVGEKQRNNGWVMLLVTDQRKVQMATGYGLEGDLPDALCKRIQMKYMVPYLKTGDWDQGMLQGVKAVCSALDGSMSKEDAGEDDDADEALLALIAFLALMGGSMAYTQYQQRKPRICPRCGQKAYRLVSTRCVEGTLYTTVYKHYHCSHCGFEEDKHDRIKRDYHNAQTIGRSGLGAGGVFIGGRGWGGGGFGGGMGGSFGGGSGGGGGASSGF